MFKRSEENIQTGSSLKERYGDSHTAVLIRKKLNLKVDGILEQKTTSGSLPVSQEQEY